MRLTTILAVLSLATAAFAFLPSADAAKQVCTVATADDCGGWICVEERADGAWDSDECTNKADLDRCQYQSDCCTSYSFWCPETE